MLFISYCDIVALLRVWFSFEMTSSRSEEDDVLHTLLCSMGVEAYDPLVLTALSEYARSKTLIKLYALNNDHIYHISLCINTRNNCRTSLWCERFLSSCQKRGFYIIYILYIHVLLQYIHSFNFLVFEKYIKSFAFN